MDDGGPACKATRKKLPKFLRSAEQCIAGVLGVVEKRTPPSLAVHRSSCCEVARAWFLAMGQVRARHEYALPVWVSQRWRWGPVSWPLHWCEAMVAEKLDCGALSFLGRQAVEMSGEEACIVQLIQRFDLSTCATWRAAWAAAEGVGQWIWGSLIYHEAVGCLDGDSIVVWDPSVDGIRSAITPEGYGSIVAVRVNLCGSIGENQFVRWGRIRLPVNSWQRVGQSQV